MSQEIIETKRKKKDEDKSLMENEDESHAVKEEDASTLKEKTNALMGERASNERKWREVQSAFASVMRSVLFNNAMPLLLKRDAILKLRLEYELWCGFCESFASNPFDANIRNDDNNAIDGSISVNFPHPINNEHFTICQESRAKMQMEILGFVPKANGIAQALSWDTSGVFTKLSTVMEKVYEDKYTKDSSQRLQMKVKARDWTERIVSACDSFPPGTRVVVFGSSANGFGSPSSDLDMCIHLPPLLSLVDRDDVSGSASMGKLAEQLEKAGMMNVDTERLGARIPVVKFNCPIKSENGGVEETTIIECDLSMQNQLACINTALLRGYSSIIPEVRLLAAIIKQWAKGRDINDPSNHTLSSYGYIIMLIYFLTTHKGTDDGIPVNVHNMDPKIKKKCKMAISPLIPNLQWMDKKWLQNPPGTPYIEWEEKPSNQNSMMVHPSEPSYRVNTYFCIFNNQETVTSLQNHLNNTKHYLPKVGILLASFFRFYAYEFDFKKHVVSLNATCKYGPIDRESKAETDGWIESPRRKLCVEDPFESFYDVAHVLKPVNFQRTRREFAMAYSKIFNAVASARSDPNSVDVVNLLDHICEETQSRSD